jgi:hypothetical protein
MKNEKDFLSYKQIEVIVMKLLKEGVLRGGTVSGMRILEFGLRFAEYQYGEKVEYNNRKRNSDVIANYDVDYLLFHVGYALANTALTLSDNSISDGIKASYYRQYAIRNLEKILTRLEYWQRELALDEMWRIDKIDGDQTDNIYSYLSSAEKDLGICYLPLLDQEVALAHCDKAALYVRKIMKDKKRAHDLYYAISLKGQSLVQQSKLREAKPVLKEAYELVAEPVFPRHKHFLQAAHLLVLTLFQLKQYEEAAPYARIYYECLSQPIDIESPEMADAAAILGEVAFRLIEKNGPARNGDIVEAEMLVRKAIRIAEKVKGSDVAPGVLILLSDIVRFKSLS